MNDAPDDAQGPRLRPEDAEAIDRLVECGFDEQRVQDERDRRVLAALRALDAYPVESSDPSLIDATLARIDAAEREQAERMRLDRRVVRRVRWADLGGIAAVMLLAVGVAWPALAGMRQAAQRAGCSNNLRAMCVGLSGYAADHRDMLPVTAGLSMLMAPRPATLDWNSYEHAGNLLLLSGNGYIQLNHLHCPACASNTPHKHFAFRMPAGDRAFRLRVVGRGALVADSNPALDMRRIGLPAAPNMASRNHAQKGQNVLFGDGSIQWLTRPEVGGDNIYLPRGVSRADLMPNLVELPLGSDDFLAH